MDSLPDAVLLHVFAHLPAVPHLHLHSAVCRRWRALLHDPAHRSLWRSLVLHDEVVPAHVARAVVRRAGAELAELKMVFELRQAFDPWKNRCAFVSKMQTMFEKNRRRCSGHYSAPYTSTPFEILDVVASEIGGGGRSRLRSLDISIRLEVDKLHPFACDAASADGTFEKLGWDIYDDSDPYDEAFEAVTRILNECGAGLHCLSLSWQGRAKLPFGQQHYPRFDSILAVLCPRGTNETLRSLRMQHVQMAPQETGRGYGETRRKLEIDCFSGLERLEIEGSLQEFDGDFFDVDSGLRLMNAEWRMREMILPDCLKTLVLKSMAIDELQFKPNNISKSLESLCLPGSWIRTWVIESVIHCAPNIKHLNLIGAVESLYRMDSNVSKELLRAISLLELESLALTMTPDAKNDMTDDEFWGSLAENFGTSLKLLCIRGASGLPVRESCLKHDWTFHQLELVLVSHSSRKAAKEFLRGCKSRSESSTFLHVKPRELPCGPPGVKFSATGHDFFSKSPTEVTQSVNF